MNVSLIITTYNWPEALKLSLKSVLKQSRLPDEIIIADDGSVETTAECIRQIAADFPIPILHSWQPDEGFRAAMSRNRAIAMAKGEYFVMIDGDIIMQPDFIQDHIDAAKKGFFVQGGRILIGRELSHALLNGKHVLFGFRIKGIRNRKNTIHSHLLSSIFSSTTNSLKGIKTCNFALFKNDAFKVNGFDNTFVGWGREDSEFANRLLCSGLKRKTIHFSAIAYHIFHNENTRSVPFKLCRYLFSF